MFKRFLARNLDYTQSILSKQVKIRSQLGLTNGSILHEIIRSLPIKVNNCRTQHAPLFCFRITLPPLLPLEKAR